MDSNMLETFGSAKSGGPILFDLNPNNFALEIEKIVLEKKCNYIDAICALAALYDIDYYTIARMLSNTMKEKVLMDAIDLKYLKE